MSKVRWGVLGCANIARKRAIPALLGTPCADLAGVASRTIEKAESLRAMFHLARAYGSYEEMLADPDIHAVYIPLPNGLHGEWMVKSAEAGKHVLCEKPFTSNAAEAERVAMALAGRGLFAMEAFMWRLHPQHAAAVAAINAGEIGPVRLVRAAFSFLMPRQPNARLVPDLAGGSVMDVGCYPVSAARFYFGCEPTRVYASGKVDPEFGVDMNASGLVEFPDGELLMDCAFDRPYRTEIEIVGEKGTILFPKPWQPESEAVLYINGTAKRLPEANQYTRQFEYFSECILKGTPPVYGAQDAILQMRVVDAIRRSILSGNPESV